MATKGMTHQKDTELRDALITLLRQSGIAVSTNVPEAERILQENRNRIYREHQINTDPVVNGVISVFSKKYQLPVEIVRSYFEGMGNEDLHQAQQAYYAIRRAYRENVKTELGDGFKLSAFSEKFAALKNELYNVFGDVDALRDREVQKAQDYRNMMDAARREAERKLQAEYDRLQPYRDMSDTEIDDLYMRALPHEVIEQYSVTEKQAAIDTLADDQKALLTDLLTVMQERRGYTSTTDYQGQGAWVAPGDPGYATDKERRANVLEDGGDVNIEDIAKGITPQPEDYFSNLTTNYPTNNVGNCGYVAAAMLLSYYDTYWNPNFIPDQYNNSNLTELDSLDDKTFDSPGVNDIHEDLWVNYQPMTAPDENSPEWYKKKYQENEKAAYRDYLDRMLARQDESFVALLYQKAIEAGTLKPSVNPRTGTGIRSIQKIVNLYISQNEQLAGKVTLNFEEYSKMGDDLSEEEQRKIIRNKAINRLKKGQPLIFGGDTHTGYGHICIAYAYDEVNDQIIIHTGWPGRENNRHVSTSDFLRFNDFAYLDVFSSLRSVPDNKRFKVGNEAYSCHDLDSFVHKEIAVAYQDEDFHALQCSCGKTKYEKHDFVSIGSGTKKCSKCGKMVSKPEWSY